MNKQSLIIYTAVIPVTFFEEIGPFKGCSVDPL